MAFGRAAMRYYPDRCYTSALRMFRQEIKDTRGLYEALKALGYNDNQRYITPKQMEAIEEHLGTA